MNTKPEDWTGERLETFILSENTNEHLHRYAMALELAAGKNVLDIACGEGYGSNLLAGRAASVTGVDIDVDTVENAAQKYQHANLTFVAGSADAMPCADRSMDLIVSFETIEHHDKHDKMMAEIKRVLRPGGVLIISSPDKQYYSDVPGYKNPYHIKELYKIEFEELIKSHFQHVQFYAQKSFVGSVVYALNDKNSAGDLKQYNGNYDAIQHTGMQAVYNLAIASDSFVAYPGSSLFNGEAILRKQLQDEKDYAVYHAALDADKNARQSTSYKVGHAITRPFAALKKLFNA